MFSFERQNVIAAVALLALFGVRSWLRPDSPPSFRAELARVAAQERELLNRYTAASADFKAGRINDPAFADIIEREILEPYAGVNRALPVWKRCRLLGIVERCTRPERGTSRR